MKSATTPVMSRDSLGFLLGILGVVIFGATLPATRLAVADLAPWFVTMGRAAVAGLLALGVLIVLRRPLPPRALRLDLALASVALVIGFPGLIGLAMLTVPANQGGVVLGILPLATAVAGALFAGDRPRWPFWAWGVAGAGLVLAFTIRKNGFVLTSGTLYLLAAVVVTGLGYVFSARASRQLPGWEVISWCCVLALPVTLPTALWLWPPDLGAVRASAWAGFAYVAIMSQYIGFFAWNAGLAMGGVARVSQTQLLQTFVTLGVAAALLGEEIDGMTVLFAVAVVGVVLAGRAAAKPKA
jgi:drug/metabolite transporter (DMT)-like permease